MWRVRHLNRWRRSLTLKKIARSSHYHIEVIDLLENPQLAKRDQILAIPTLVRQFPPPLRKIVGDLSNTERVLVGLDLRMTNDQPLQRILP